ncbi:hypothetical protein [Streptomyces collinus]|uniref:hypothetical protein n=1 Tax=Streptomyces collinus TaxID=42684 RepID=UPI00378996D0
MRVRATAATAALLLAALTACGGGGSDSSSASKSKAPDSKNEKVDCTSQTLDQAEWMKHCAEETGADPDTGAKSTGLKFGETYTWPDGLKASVVDAKVFTDFNSEYGESAEPGSTDFRVALKLENTGKKPTALDDLSLIVEGATNGGEASFTAFENGSQPLEGRLAPGVTATKNADHVLETKYGKKIVVTVQRNSENFDLEFPEFNGAISG